MVTIKLDNVSWPLLREQKELLISLQGSGTISQNLHYLGLVNLLDEIQDQAAEQIGPHVVFDDGDGGSPKPPVCVDCKGPGEVMPCPYAQDIHGDDTLTVLCVACANSRAEDI